MSRSPVVFDTRHASRDVDSSYPEPLEWYESDGVFWGVSFMPSWAKPKYGKGEIDRAGAVLIDDSMVFDQDGYERYEGALDIINNWRSSHSYPLQALKMTLKYRARRVDSTAIVAQRLKRLSSIETKLRRNKHMALSQMQDLGGCRAVVRTVGHVDHLVALFESAYAKNPNARSQFVRKSDYITQPKDDGYRSVHLIYKYRSGSKSKRAWNGLRIEIQIRSRLQHAWATAVETVDAFTKQAIKTGGGQNEWKRFFLLMAGAIAQRERRPVCPGCPDDPGAMRLELRSLADQLNVKSLLTGWTNAMKYLEPRVRPGIGVYLLYLDTAREEVTVTGFLNTEQAKASDEYLEIEKRIKNTPTAQAVLVEVESIRALREAYPNYFADTGVFIEAMERALPLSDADSGKRAPAAASRK